MRRVAGGLLTGGGGAALGFSLFGSGDEDNQGDIGGQSNSPSAEDGSPSPTGVEKVFSRATHQATPALRMNLVCVCVCVCVLIVWGDYFCKK
jgi:hypothetical protein